MKFRRHLNDPTSRISWQVALGVRELDLPNWERVREAQHAEAARQLPIVYALTLVAVLLTVAVLWQPARNAPLLGWASCDAITMLALMWMTRSPRHARRLIGGNTHLHSFVRGTLLGLLWVIPPALFAGSGTEVQRLGMALISAGMMAFTAITALTLPLGMMMALLIASVGVSVMLRDAGGTLPLILLPQLYAVTLAMGGVLATRAFLRRRWSEDEAAEKREVVSLLLREFEEEDTDWLWQTDAAKALVQVSPRLAEAARRPIEELEGMSLPRVIAGEPWPSDGIASELSRLIELLNARESFSDLPLPVTVAGETRWWSLSATPRFDQAGLYLGFRGKGSDITERRRSAERIDWMARYDALTGLGNREHFMGELRKALALAHRSEGACALLLVDLDRFKPVNDTMGHPIGDRLLKLVAERLRNLIGEDEFAGRLGGDEFGLLLRRAVSERVAQLGDGVIARLSEPFEIDGHLIRIGASMGSAIGPRDGRTLETLVRHADLALYRAKGDGRGCHRRYDPSLLAATNRRRQIEEGLRRALDADLLHLLYQPIVDVENGRVMAFEALVRWTDPELGEVPPATFIPIAEEARLSSRLGEWVLRTACAVAATWPEEVRICVNLSGEQLNDRQLAATILSALSHAGLAPGRLVVELSEAVLMRGGGEIPPPLQALRTMGVSISLDDFGTGQAALAHISGGAVDTIKIDHILVRGVAHDRPDALALVRAVVALAKSLDITTVAEGTETELELTRMRSLGCGYAQGHLIGSPLPERAAGALVGEAMRATA